jgi:glycosyltransferase involved in cell wall biosynthesis
VRILITVPWGERLGGAEEMLQRVLDGAPEEGHELELVFLQDGSWPLELARAGFRVEVLPMGRIRHAHRLLAGIWRLARLLRRRRPDLILNWMPKTQLYCAPAALLAGMSDRLIWWQHEITAGHWLDRCATVLPALAVGCSSSAAAQAQSRLRPSRKTFVVAPGTPIPLPTPGSAPLVLPQDVPIVGIVGRLQPWKGQDRLLRAQQELKERGLRMHTVIVGGDAHGLSSEYAASLPSLVDELGLGDSVTLTGQVPDAGPYIEQMDVMVNASDPEPFGIVLLEAMAREVAVVAVASGGPLEIVEDGVSGVLARSGEPASLADALSPLLVSRSRREEIARAGHERFMEEFTDVAMRERLFRQLQTLLDERGSRTQR